MGAEVFIWNGVGHVGGVDHGRNSPKERNRTVDQSEVVLLLSRRSLNSNEGDSRPVLQNNIGNYTFRSLKSKQLIIIA